MSQNQLKKAAENDEKIKSVEKGHKVALETQGVHFEKHFNSKKDNKEEVGDLLEVVEPFRLAIMLSCKHTCVEKYQDDDEPEHGL